MEDEEEGLPYPGVAPVVCLHLNQMTKPRNWCLKMTFSLWMRYASLLFALLNCFTLATYTPFEQKTHTIEILEAFIFGFFVSEMLIKMVALGVRGYVSNKWNKVDVFVLFGEVLDYFLALFGIHLEVSQILEPLRLISRVPRMKALVTVLLDIIPMLANVFILYVLVIHIFAVMGIQLWAGQLQNRCFLGEDINKKYNVSLSPYYLSKYGEKIPFICSSNGKNGMQHCRNVPPYKMNGKICSLAAPHNASPWNELYPAVAGASDNNCVNWNMYYNVCRVGNLNPHMGAISFDNIGYAWLATFQVVMLEGWAEIMFFVMDAHSFWSLIFFILVTIMGSFIMMNVCAVSIATKFSESVQSNAGAQNDGATVAQLCAMLVSCLQRISSRFNRNRSTVHPSGSATRTSLVQAWRPFKRKLRRTVTSNAFDRVVMFVVFLSILTMAIEHHEQPKELTQALQISNIIFAMIFFVEMALKLLALSWSYFADRNNLFDFAIVIISFWELIAKADSRLSVLRAFRLLRFVRLVHFLPYLRRQLLVLKKTMEDATDLCGLLLLFIFIFSLLGMKLFGGEFSLKTQHERTIADWKNFDTLLWSMVTVFQILTLEDWNLVLYKAMAATSPWAALYFIALIVIGKLVLLNILVGIVVQSFQDRSTTGSDQESSLSSELSSNSIPTSLSPTQTDTREDNGHSCTLISSLPEEEYVPADPNTDNLDRSLSQIQKVLRWCKDREDWSFFLFSPQNRFRALCHRVISNKMFDHTILLFILLSCVTIALERPGIDPKSTERWIMNMSSYVFSAVFLVEMIFKVLALGLLFGKESYCRSYWNVVDGSLVVLSLVHVIVSLVSAGNSNMLGILKVFRLLRTLRPLRVIKRAPKLKLAVEALIASVKPIGNIVLICCAFFFFFGILGVQLFKGKFFYCVGPDTRNITTKADCLSANYSWVPKTYNFDSLPQALMSLFVMYSKDGWVNLMYDGLDAVGVGKQPVRNHNEWMLLFFIPYMVLSFVLLDMFVGVMVETFHQCQQEQKTKDALLQAEEGQELQDHGVEAEQIPYYANYSPLRRSIYTLCTSKFPDLFATVIIFISVMMMSFEHYNQPPYIEKLMEYSYYVFTVILIIEVQLKLVAFGVMRFMQSSWNVLDVGIILISIISIIFTELKMADAIPINPSILRVCRVLRLAHVLKAKRIRVLLKTIIKTLSQVGNICLLFTFFFFIYAALGVEVFGKLECSDDYPCQGLHRHTNFQNFGKALLTLYQVCTGDNWSGIMKDTLRPCRPSDIHCLSYLSWISPVYFSTFVVMAQFVLVNLVVATIMQALEDSHEEKSANLCLPLEEEEVLDGVMDAALATVGDPE